MTTLESWIDAPKERAGGVLVRYAHALESRLEARIANWEIYSAVYSEQLEVALRPSRTRYLRQPTATRNANLTFNVARSLVDTEHATVTEAEPRPTIFTEGGNRPQQDKAAELQRALDGIFSDLRTYATMERAELDKGILGTGVVKGGHFGGRPTCERRLISEILVDEDLIGAGKDPQAVIDRMEVSRAAMLVYFKDEGAEVLQAIKDAPAIVTSGVAGERADLIVVYDAYSLPIDSETPGMHRIGIENYEGVVFEEEWTSPRLPFVFMHWQRPVTGFYGIGIIEQVLGLQVEINRFFRNVSRALKNWGVPTVLLPTLAKINTLQWTNSPDGKILPFDPQGGQPVMWTGQILSPEVMAWLQFVIDTCYKVTGIPQNVAFAQREPGIPSAEGQRNITQKAASRLEPQSKGYERAWVDLSWVMDDVIRRLKEAGEKLEISTVDQGALHKVDIDEAISLTPGSYRIDVAAGNLLSRHPASKREEVQELAKAQIFDKDEAKQLILRPDVEAMIGKVPDVRGIYLAQITAAIKKGIYTEPEAFWPQLPLGVTLYSNALFEAQASGVPAEHLDVMRDWLRAAKDIMQPPGAPPPSSPAPQPTPQPQQEAA